MYNMQTEPELPDCSRVLNKITALCRDLLKEKLGVYMPVNRVVFSIKQVQDTIEQTVEHDGQTYKMTLSWCSSMRQSEPTLNQFFCLLFKQMMKRVRFEQIGRNCYNPARMVKVENI